MDFAKSSTALPTEGEAGQWRDSVADMIGLQAVWFALHHIDELGQDERMLGLNRSEVIIGNHEKNLRKRWPENLLPEELQELIEDAQSALHMARQHVDPKSNDQSLN